MTSVPEQGLLHSTGFPASRSKGPRTSGGTPCGSMGKGCSRTSPASSRRSCPFRVRPRAARRSRPPVLRSRGVPHRTSPAAPVAALFSYGAGPRPSTPFIAGALLRPMCASASSAASAYPAACSRFRLRRSFVLQPRLFLFPQSPGGHACARPGCKPPRSARRCASAFIFWPLCPSCLRATRPAAAFGACGPSALRASAPAKSHAGIDIFYAF